MGFVDFCQPSSEREKAVFKYHGITGKGIHILGWPLNISTNCYTTDKDKNNVSTDDYHSFFLLFATKGPFFRFHVRKGRLLREGCLNLICVFLNFL